MIVVTAPTGLIGHQVLNNLLNSDEPVRVIARDTSRLPVHTRGRFEVVEGSHGDLDVLTQAFADADSVFWLVPPDPQASSIESAYVDFTRPACEAFKSQGVKRVVGISALGRGTQIAANAGHVTASLAMDDLIASTGVSYRALTMPSFMDNLLYQVGPIKNLSMFFSPISGDRKLPACATRDIAAAAARLLLDHSWSGRGSGWRRPGGSILQRHGPDHVPGATATYPLPANPRRDLQSQDDRKWAVRCYGAGHA